MHARTSRERRAPGNSGLSYGASGSQRPASSDARHHAGVSTHAPCAMATSSFSVRFFSPSTWEGGTTGRGHGWKQSGCEILQLE